MDAFVWELTKETIDLPLGCLQELRRILGRVLEHVLVLEGNLHTNVYEP